MKIAILIIQVFILITLIGHLSYMGTLVKVLMPRQNLVDQNVQVLRTDMDILQDEQRRRAMIVEKYLTEIDEIFARQDR